MIFDDDEGFFFQNGNGIESNILLISTSTKVNNDLALICRNLNRATKNCIGELLLRYCKKQ